MLLYRRECCTMKLPLKHSLETSEAVLQMEADHVRNKVVLKKMQNITQILKIISR